MPCSANSTATSARKKVQHEAPHPRFARGRSVCCARSPGWSVPGPCNPAQYRWHAQKPFYILRYAVIEPKAIAGHSISGRLYCTPKALWKLSWFLRDFGYDTESLGRDEIDEKNLVGLQGVVKISHTIVNGTSLLNLDGFAPTSQWAELPPASPAHAGSEVAR
jgi:hypothetical protein